MSTNTNSHDTNPPDTDKFPLKTGKTGPEPGSPPIPRTDKGRFLPGNNANPKGRPKGKLNQSTIFARALLEESAPDVARQAIADAKAGKSVAVKLVLERTIPKANDRRLQLDNFTRAPRRDQPDTLEPDDLLQAHNNLIQAVTDGELSPLEAQAISHLLEARRRSWESLELKKQLNELQDRFEATQNGKPRR